VVGRGEIWFCFKLIYHTLQPRRIFLEQRGVPFVIAVLDQRSAETRGGRDRLVLVLTGLASEPTSDIKKEPLGSTVDLTLTLLLLIYLTRKKQKRVKKKKRI
jgi:hypothetical protein